jgi:hypothetical protein
MIQERQRDWHHHLQLELRVCWVERVFSEERGEGCGLLLGPLALLYLIQKIQW